MSPDCFPAGTLVLTEQGYRPIEEIEVGDRVLTHQQRWRRVTETSRAFRPLITLRGHGHPGLTMSPEHPIYARQRKDMWRTEPRGYERTLDPADWLPASALDRGWYWATPTTFPLEQDVPVVGRRGMPFDQRLMWLAGRYVGDGWTRLTDDRAELVITCGRHEVDRLREKLAAWPRQGGRAAAGELAWHERETATAYQFSTNHRGLVEWLREEFGHGAESKRLPAWALGLAPLMRGALLEGYLSADGWRHDDFYEARTVSKALAFSVKALVTSLGNTATVHLLANSSEIDGRTVLARPIYLLRWRHALDAKRAQTFRLDDGFEWAPIREQIDVVDSAEVFNIGVEEDESYVVEGIVVHNCKHFSKAKGGQPREKAIRGLAWVGLRWVKSLPPWQRPRVVILENVEEFQDWGPLREDGKPCPVQRGATFREFVRAFEACGYVVEWRELRACDYGAPTIRKRLFLIARRDGKPIVWPEPTHGDPKSEAVRAGRLKPWRTAAEIIDWSLPCPSIFDTEEEIRAKWGIRAKRPLADATMARIAKGTMRYVVQAARPFLVRINHGDSRGRRDRGLDEPMPTATHHGGDALVTPFVSYAQQGGASRDIADPLHTITASPKDHNTVVAPFVTRFNTGAVGRSLDEPINTITSHASETHGGGAAPLGLVSGILVPRYGERPGQEPRSRSVEEPAPVIVPTGNEGSLAAIHLTCQFGASVGSAAEEPVGTITAGGAGKAGVVAAFLAQHTAGSHPGQPAKSVDEPLSTLTAKGCQQSVVAAHLLNLRGSDRRGGPVDAPAPTVSAQGNHAAAVYAFLAKYYGEGLPSQPADEPLHTVTTKPRHGVVTVIVGGQPYAIVDIGMRMLTPRERFSAQGFRRDYVIDRGELEDGTIVPLTLEQQGRMCGNSVVPALAEALVAANYREAEARPQRRPAADLPLFAVE
nr:DNA cytosine methyltransferase [Methylobacterium aquaticum]